MVIYIIVLTKKSFLKEKKKISILLLSKVCYDLSPYRVIRILPTDINKNIEILDICCYIDLSNLQESIHLIKKYLALGIPVITTNIYAYEIERDLKKLARRNHTYFFYDDIFMIDKTIGLINQINFYAK